MPDTCDTYASKQYGKKEHLQTQTPGMITRLGLLKIQWHFNINA